MRSRSIASVGSLLLVVLLMACGGGATDKIPTPPVAAPTAAVASSIAVSTPSTSIAIGGSVQIDASPRDRTGSIVTAAVTWSSQYDSVATVAANGLVTGVRAGNTAITASVSAGTGKVSSTLSINVVPPFAGSPPPRNVLVNDPRRAIFPNLAQYEPSVAVSGTRIVVGWNDERLGGAVLRGMGWSVGYGYSLDGGSSFFDAGEVGNSQWGADPTVAVDRAGRFYLARIDMLSGLAGENASSPDRIAIFRSADGGFTFPQSATVTGNASGSNAGINDKPSITTDNTGGVFDGSVYASWTLAVANNLQIQFAGSSDGGATFSAPLRISAGTKDQGSVPVVGPHGEVYVLWVDQGSNNIRIRRSTDRGVTFTPEVDVASFAPVGAFESSTSQYCGRVIKGSLRVGSSPMIAVDRSAGPNSGKLYVVFGGGGAGNDMADVFLTTSTDGGATWSAPRRLNDDLTSNDQWLPFVAVAPNGTVGVSWYDRRQDPQNLQIDVFMRMSTDGGASFGPNRKITEVSFPPPGLNLKLGFPPYSCYMSSYNYMVADDRNFYVVWTDNRMVTAGAVDPNIMFAKVPY